MEMSNITGKVVVITGASSGIGESTAKLLAAQGAKVVLGSAAFGPDRRSGSRDLSFRRQGDRIRHRCDEARRSGSAHPKRRRQFRPRRCAPQ
jgi:NAD(P)-dependent dehydrogenase (short-subunit alcohol dehydrogenase family)